MIDFPFEVTLPKNEIELEELVLKITGFIQYSTVLGCSSICDQHRGYLQIGDKLKEVFQINIPEEPKPKKPKLERVK